MNSLQVHILTVLPALGRRDGAHPGVGYSAAMAITLSEIAIATASTQHFDIFIALLRR